MLTQRTKENKNIYKRKGQLKIYILKVKAKGQYVKLIQPGKK